MTRSLRYSAKAQADLDEIFDFIAADNPLRAASYIEDIRRACQNLCATPFIGVSRPEVRPGLYILPLWRRIVLAYELPEGHVDVIRVFSTRQDYEALIQND